MKNSLGKGGLQFTDRERKEIRKKFQPVTLTDEIAEYIQGVKFQPQSWDRFGDSKLRKGKEKSFNLTWIAKDGVRIDVIAKDFVMHSGQLELDEYAVIDTIVELASGYPRGLTEYYYDRVQEQTKQDYNHEPELMEDDRISDEDWLAMQKTKAKRKSTATKTKRSYTSEFTVIKRLHDLNGKKTTAKVLNAIVDKCAELRTKQGISHKPVLSAIYYKLGKALLRINKAKINTISKLELSRKLLDPIEKVISNPKIKQVTLGGSDFNKRLLKFKRGIDLNTELSFGLPSDILQKHGLPNKPIILPASVIKKATQDKHLLLIEHFINLDDQINKPIAIIKGNTLNSLVALTELKDLANNPVIVVVKFNIDSKNIKISNVASIYGKHLPSIKRWIQTDKILWEDKKRKTTLSAFSALLAKGRKERLSGGSKIQKKPNLQANGQTFDPGKSLAGKVGGKSALKFPIKVGKISNKYINNDLSAGNVYLEKGNLKFGYIHILNRHDLELQKANITAIDFAKWVITNFSEIRYDHLKQTYLIIYSQQNSKSDRLVFVALKAKQGKNYYTVITEGFGKKRDLAKLKLICSRTPFPDESLSSLGGVSRKLSQLFNNNTAVKAQRCITPQKNFSTTNVKNTTTKQKKSTLGSVDIVEPNKPAKGANPFNNLTDLQSGGIYQLNGDLGKLLGNLGVVETSITIKGDQGAGKSQLMWMMVNAFAELGKRVAVVSPEMSAKSPTISNYRDKYVSSQNQQRVLFTDSKLTVEDLDKMAHMYDVLFVDSFNNLEDYEQKQFKWLFQRQPNKAIIGLFQSTTSGEMRGGNRPEFDAYVNVEVRKVDDTFKNNYAVCTKNRFGGTGLKFNISKQKIQK